MCPICRGGDLSDHDDLARCRTCGHVYQRDTTAVVRYDAEYLKTYETYPRLAMTCLRLGYLKAHLETGRLLDVGHGAGDFVRMARDAGFDAFGHDIHGVDVGIRESPLVGDETWDVVTFFDSLEHFEDLAPVRSLARRARLILVSLPQTPPSFPDDRTWKHYKPGEHLHYFSLESLATLFNGHRLERISNVEDAIRRGPGGRPNIRTASFRREDPTP